MSDGVQTSSSQSQTSNKLLIVFIVLLLIVLILSGLIVYLLLKPEEQVIIAEPVGGGRGTVVTEDNVEEIREQLEVGPVPDSTYVTSMSIDWHFDGQTSKDAYVANSVANTRTVYFDLILADTSELIYSSPYIPVGAELKEVTLSKELKKGTYDTILIYHLVDDDKNELSTVSIALTIYVE